MPFGNYLPHPTEGTNLGSDDGTDDEGLVRSRPRSSTAWLGCMEHVFKTEDDAMNCMKFFNIYMFLCALCHIVTDTHTHIYIYINIMDADIKPHIRVHTCFSYRLSSWGWVKIVGPQGSIPLCRRYVTLHKACSETGIPQIVLSFMNMMKNHGVRGPSAPLSVDPTFLIT